MACLAGIVTVILKVNTTRSRSDSRLAARRVLRNRSTRVTHFGVVHFSVRRKSCGCVVVVSSA
jgi:hypothetical protein